MPASSTKRMAPVDLSVRTHPTRGNTDKSLPQTPTSRSPRTAKGNPTPASQSKRPPPRETFLDDGTPVENVTGVDGDQRHSHDLSMSLRDITRDSLVDNMLMSLDEFSPHTGRPRPGMEKSHNNAQIYSSFSDDEVAALGSRYNLPKVARPRGHTHSTSQSSDYDLYAVENPNRQSNHLPQGRRSISSSNFFSGLDRIDSHRGGDKELRRGHEPQRVPPQAERQPVAHSRGWKGKGSKSSASSSFDLGNGPSGFHRWAALGRKRSSSFDHSYVDDANRTPQGPLVPDELMMNDQQQNALYDNYDAAPTPTVPVGRRRHDSTVKQNVFPPQPTHAPPQAPPAPFMTEHQSSPLLYNKKERSTTLGTSVVKSWEDGHASGDFRAQEHPTLPAFVGSPTPDSAASDRDLSYYSPPAAARERPGFFRRVFGSSKNTSPSAPRNGPPQLPPVGVHSTRKPDSQALAEQTRSSSQVSDKLPSEAPPPPAVLTKKPSSFFRRRKKSVSESTPPPPAVPLHLQPSKQDPVSGAIPSPVSSLRKVMNPYIQNPAAASDTFYDTSELIEDGPEDGHLNLASTSSRPAKATIRSVKPESRESDSRALSPHASIGYPAATEQARVRDNKGRRTSNKPLLEGGQNESRAGHEDTLTTPVDRGQQTTPRKSSVVQNPTESSARVVEDQSASEAHKEPATRVAESRKGSLAEAPKQRQDSATSSTSNKSKAKQKKESLEWVKTTSPIGEKYAGLSSGEVTPKGTRVWLEPTASEESLTEGNKLFSPIQGPPDSGRFSGSSSDYKSASSLPIVQVDDEVSEERSASNGLANVSSSANELEPTIEDRDRARRIFAGSEEVITKVKAAPWLGDCLAENVRTRKAYMELFDWTNISILAAMRDLCSKLVLKGETQQVDRILDSASGRWCECNPNHGFKATDVVHTICYSILLLNTDLHMAEIEQKMTRSQFIKNTLPTIRRVAADSAPDAFEPKRASTVPARGQIPWMEPKSPVRSPTEVQLDAEKGKSSLDSERPTPGDSHRPSPLEDLTNRAPTPLELESSGDDCGPLVKVPFHGTSRGWEVQVDTVLKNFYHSIRQQRLPLHGAPRDPVSEPQSSSNSLQVLANGVLRRSPSTISKAPSEIASSRGRPDSHRLGTGRWGSKTRSRQRLHSSSNQDSGRTSLDDQSSMWSPSVSSTWSKYSLGKTQTSMSVDSFGSSYPQGDYQQSIGFANALSQAIVREESSTNLAPDDRDVPLLEDESLGLAGAPWAKEGILTHKHHLEPLGKKAKDRNWNQCFAVIETGWMRLFSFASKGSMRQRNKARPQTGGVVGGGNWTENAEALGSFLLRQTIASALPPPGYSKARPHVWALSLPTGAVHLFQVGTPEIVKEFVSTANYWSARLSKEPLVGGVSNVEYGWGDSVINNALLAIESVPQRQPSTQRPSLQSSIRSSMDHSNSTKPKLPGDRVVISDWSPPQQSMMASRLVEIDQLKALLTYVKNIEAELQKHNMLRGPMLLAFSSRQPNANKAMANWERKSSYLLREIVKFRTYIDSLMMAQSQKEKLYANREDDTTDSAHVEASAPATTS
ncbi:MAG: hypothetical protein M1837_002867 [Sclerophora amabilis]|nr:MAG: hypothetical protein M1837_002867 [Sclerophora amabilis]